MKTLAFISTCSPDRAGYPDRYYLHDDTANALISAGIGSCCPNPIQPSTSRNWSLVYGWVACGRYAAECVEHYKYGKCILIAGGGCIPTRFANPAHDNLMVASGIFVHGGATEVWRGSAGCLTTPKYDFRKLMTFFTVKEKLFVSVIDYSNKE